MAGRDITKESATLRSKVDGLLLKARVGSAVSLYLGVLLLGQSHVGIVDTQLHIIDGGSGQRISDEVVFSLQMSNVCREFRDE